MSKGEDEIRRALGTVGFIDDIPVTRGRPKLPVIRNEAGELDVEQGVWMALAFCFDLVRRFELMYTALRPFGEQADPEIARQFAEQNDRLEALGQDYQRIAETLEQMIIALASEREEDHADLRKRILGS